MAFRFQGSVCSNLDDIKVFIGNVLDQIRTVIDDEDIIFDLRLILNELIINGVIHGNKYNERKCVELSLSIIENTIRIEVSDQGSGFNYDCNTYNPEELKFDGRGLVIVDGLSDEMHIQDNRIVAVKHMM